MFTTKTIICIVALIAFFVANKIHFGYNRGLNTGLNTVFDIAGIVAGVRFIWLMSQNITLYTIPGVLLFISVCLYIRYKKKKKFCTPCWRVMKVTAFSYSTLGVAGLAMDVLELGNYQQYNFFELLLIGIVVAGVSIALVIISNIFFSYFPTRLSKAKYYY